MTANQSAPTTPGWRIAVIGVVAALAIAIGVVFGALMLDSRSAAIGSGASYVPASAPLYFELRLEPSEVQDAALREFLGRFPPIEDVDLAQPLYPQLTAKLDELLAAEGAEVTWAADVEPWFDGHVGFALLEVPDAALRGTLPEPGVEDVPSAVILVGVDDRAAAEASIDRILAEAEVPVSFTEQEHAGVTIHVEGDSGAAWALTDDQLLFAPAADDIAAAIDAHASSSTTLSEAGDIAAMTDALPDEWLLFGIYDFTDVIAGALSGPAASPGADALRDLLANQPMRGAMALTVDGDRVSVEVVSQPPAGSFSVSNADRGLADEVPGDALYYAEGGNVGASLSGLIGSLKESVAAMPDASQQLDMVEAALGGPLEEQVEWMGDAATVAGFDGEQPWGGAVIVPTDMEQARRTMGQLATFAALATLDPSIGITVEERDVDGVEVVTVRWQDAGAEDPAEEPSEMPFVPPALVAEWAVTDDRVLIGIGDGFVERLLAQDAAGSLAETARYTDAVEELGGSDNAGLTWVDLDGVHAALAAAAGELAPADALAWFEPLDRFVAVSRIEGGLLDAQSVLLVE